MAWKDLFGVLARMSRRRFVTTVFVYGLSLTVRFTSATGNEAEIPARPAQNIDAMNSIMINDGAHIVSRSRGSRGCSTACERSIPMSPVADCPPP